MEKLNPTFTFGKNWCRFLKSYTNERQEIAKEALLKFLGLVSLDGKSFLDIGSGSGIHSAAAFLAGARRIHSFDYDPDSVSATRYLHHKLGSPTHWTIAHASVLDDSYMERLGAYDIIYSWGVLHHTGDQWHAIDNVMKLVRPGSRLFIALYSKEACPSWEYWIEVKRKYNQEGFLGKLQMELSYVWVHVLYKKLFNIPKLLKRIWGYHHLRGMAFWSDIRDWLGGWPTEFTSVKEVSDYAREKYGLVLVNLCFGEANSEFLFVKKETAEAEGLKVVNEKDFVCCLQVFSDNTFLNLSGPVWVFGAARGATVLYDYLVAKGVKVAGFIDITPSQSTHMGLRVVAFDDFVNETNKDALVILASKYVAPNWERLKQSGFHNVYNAFDWIQCRVIRGLV